MALSMEEQRILDEMERNLIHEDPRLASRLSAFGQQRLPGTLSSRRARTMTGILALVLIAAVTVMMFVFSPYGGHRGAATRNNTPPASTTSSAGTGARAATGR